MRGHSRLPALPPSCSRAPASRPNRRGPMGMKRLDRLQPPRLALLALFLGPHDRLPVGREDEAGAGVGPLRAGAPRLVDIKAESLLAGALVPAPLHIKPGLPENNRGAPQLLPALAARSRGV